MELIHSFFSLFPFSSFINRYYSILPYFYFFFSPLTGFIRLTCWSSIITSLSGQRLWNGKYLGEMGLGVGFFLLFFSLVFVFIVLVQPFISQLGLYPLSGLWHDIVWIYVCTLIAPSFQSLVTASYRIVMSLILHLFSLDSLEDLLTRPNHSFPCLFPTSLPQQPISSVRKRLNLNHGTDDRLDPSVHFWIHFSRQISS